MWGLPAPFPATHSHHGNVLILAFYHQKDLIGPHALFVCDNGQLRSSPVDQLTSEWRFNWNTHVWEDVSEGVLDDQTSDGGPEIPGDIPDTDRADRGDPSNQGDGAPGGLDS